MKEGFFFGIDTSNYTTSAAAITTAGEVFCAKRLLSVPQGERGVRQSDALFCHTRDLPEVIGEVMARVPDLPLLAVGVSRTPRRVQGSYMPCFLAGVSAAEAIARTARVPLHAVSHQEGHIEAVRFTAAQEGRVFSQEEFFAFHLSGGTTELLQVRQDGARYETEIVGETLDLTLGQLIDRCGVALGLPFPAGAHLEALAQKSHARFSVKIPKKEGGINLSGFENKFQKLLAEGMAREDCARFVFAVAEAAIRALLPEGEGPVLLSGGVASSSILRAAFGGERFIFAAPAVSSDNAVGVAALCRKGEGYGS